MAEDVVIDGFKMRGLDMTRIEVFTDAAFAFAVTLLVVSIDQIPSRYEELIAVVKGIPAFGVSFVILFMFWFSHHTWSQRYGLDDTATIWLSAILVFIVMVYVYPLKMVANAALTQLFGLDGGLQVGSAEEIYMLFVIYGAGFVGMALIIMLLYMHAYRLRHKIGLNAIERHVTLSEIRNSGVLVLVGGVSITLALTLPRDTPNALVIGLPGWSYMTLAIITPLMGLRMSRKQQRLLTEQPAEADT